MGANPAGESSSTPVANPPGAGGDGYYDAALATAETETETGKRDRSRHGSPKRYGDDGTPDPAHFSPEYSAAMLASPIVIAHKDIHNKKSKPPMHFS